jgi:hypothetical protein
MIAFFVKIQPAFETNDNSSSESCIFVAFIR